MVDWVLDLLLAYLIRYIVPLVAEIDLRIDEYLAIDSSDCLFNYHIFALIIHSLILIRLPQVFHDEVFESAHSDFEFKL